MKKTLLTSAATLLTCAAAQAVIINVDNYTINTALGHAGYPDSGSELTDGITDTPVWGGSETVVSGPLVGWLNTNPSVTFNLLATEVVNTVSIWFADSNNVAGVGMPTSVRIQNHDSTFDQTFTVTDPAGAGSMARVNLSLPAVNSSQFTVSATRGHQWTMISEVQFDTQAVPEPTSTALLGLGGLALILRRKK